LASFGPLRGVPGYIFKKEGGYQPLGHSHPPPNGSQFGNYTDAAYLINYILIIQNVIRIFKLYTNYYKPYNIYTQHNIHIVNYDKYSIYSFIKLIEQYLFVHGSRQIIRQVAADKSLLVAADKSLSSDREVAK